MSFGFFYFYDGNVINLENEKLFNTKNENISKIEEISFTNPYVKNKTTIRIKKKKNKSAKSKNKSIENKKTK